MSSRGNPQILSGATNTTIHGGTFAAVNGDMHVHSTGSNRYGLKLLLANISKGAFHNAAERGDPPRCHPQTRTAIRTEMMEWIKSTDAKRKLIFWLYGPAGAGKTAIEQSIAEQCEEEGLLAASFFFSRGAAGRNVSTRFVATIAYQLSRSIPKTREPILAAIEDDPTIFSRSLSAQMQTLVIAPLKSVRISNKPRAVVADGIDECGPDGRSQAELLTVLGAAAVELAHVPIIFVVASRPEYDIRFIFNQEPLRSVMKGLFLDNDYKADADIRHYFISKFEKVRENQLALGTDLRLPWPKAREIDYLVKKSSGQFIFAATVMKFIDDPHRLPVDRLNIILGLSNAGKETPFEALDSLYRHILSAVDDLPKVLQVLTLLMLDPREPNHVPTLVKTTTVNFIEMLLGFEIRRALMDVHALLFVPHPKERADSVIRIHHASLFDFLMDQSRSRDYFIDVSQGHILLCKCWLRMIKNDHPFQPVAPPLDYSIGRFIYHFDKSSTSPDAPDYLANFDLRAVLEKINHPHDMYLIRWDAFFDCAAKYQQQKRHRLDILHRFRNEYYGFIMDKVAQYPSSLQPYIPALFFHPNEAQTHLLYSILLKSAGESVASLFYLDQRLLMIQQRPLVVTVGSLYRHHDHDDPHLRYKDFLGEESDIQTSFSKRVLVNIDQRVVIGRSFAALAKRIIRLCPNPGESGNHLTLLKQDLSNVDLVGLLRHCSINLELARMLQDHIHLNTDSPILRSIVGGFPSKVILEYVTEYYIKKCPINQSDANTSSIWKRLCCCISSKGVES